MKRMLAFVVVASVIFASSVQARSNSDRSLRIAVVGAGASGLTAAYTLQKMGYENVVVFEKENRPGGKVHSIEVGGKMYELGAVWFGDDYKTIVELAEELNVPHFVAKDTGVIRNNKTYSYETYILRFFNPFRVLKAMYNFFKVEAKFLELKRPGFDNVHPDLHMNLDDFAQKYDIKIVTDVVSSFITGCGYGYYEEVPAQYLMKLIPLVMRGKVSMWIGTSKLKMSSFTNGWQSLWQAVADELDVRYSTPVTGIERYTVGGEYYVDVTAGDETVTFDRVIVSAPLQFVHEFMDTTDEEEALFSQIKSYDYAVTLFTGKNIPHASLIDNVTADTIGKVNFLGQFHEGTNINSAYQLLPKGQTEAQSIQMLIDGVKAVGGTFDEVVYRKVWNYFPFVTKEVLDAGFYEDLESMQGDRGTYYIGGIMNFETVETTAAYAKDLVETEFGD